MKWLYKTVIALLFVLAIASIGGTLYFFNRINNEYDSNAVYSFDGDARYHFSLILKSDGEVYWQDFLQGVYEAASANQVAVEYNPVEDPDSSIKMMEYINIAKESRVDGVIVNGNSTPEYIEAINEAAEEDIHIVLGGVESTDSSRLSYVGTNFYEYGVQAAKLMAQIKKADGPIEVAVILSGDETVQDAAQLSQSDIMLNGLRSVIDVSDSIEVSSIMYRQSNLLGAEDLTRNILTENSGVDVIFCTNAKDTVAAARVIVERNLVGDVYIVGTDVTEEIINYIQKGIVYGVLDRNGYEAGYKCVEVLYDNFGVGFQPSYIDIDIDIYTSLNMASYRKN